MIVRNNCFIWKNLFTWKNKEIVRLVSGHSVFEYLKSKANISQFEKLTNCRIMIYVANQAKQVTEASYFSTKKYVFCQADQWIIYLFDFHYWFHNHWPDLGRSCNFCFLETLFPKISHLPWKVSKQLGQININL